MKNKFIGQSALLLILCFLASVWAVQPVRAAAASLYLAPSSGTKVIGSTFSVAIKVNTGGEVVNAAEGSLSFDKDIIEAVGISKGGSIFPFWTTEPSYNNGAGSISFGGGLPPPAYSGTAGHIFSISFRAKKAGTAAVRFTSGAVLANDGKGTNILASMGSAGFTISPKVTTPAKQEEPAKKEALAEPEYNTPVIKSSTHPDPNQWYNKNLVKFSWELPAGVNGVSIGFDNNPVGDPGPASDGLFSEKEYNNVEDGVWYLHLKFKDARRWGTIAHYRVMIDTKPPEPFDVRVKRVEIGEWPVLGFKAIDKDSGIDKYEIIIGSLEEQAHEVGADANEFSVSGLPAGVHTALVKAIDKAGNERVATVEFQIEPIEAPQILNYAETIKASDKFYMNGMAVPETEVIVYIADSDKIVATTSVNSDLGGSWFYISDKSFDNGRYVAWAVAVNKKGIKSYPSSKVSFLVSPPVFAIIGNFVINYFTILVSLLFMIILIVTMIFWLIWLVRRKLKKETIEIEQVLRNNSIGMKNTIDEESVRLIKTKTASERKAIIELLKKRVDENEKKTLKEIKDVEEILK